jgi:hypothetical protein
VERITFPAQGDRGMHKTGIAVLAAICAALIAAAVVVDVGGSSGDGDTAARAPAPAVTTSTLTSGELVVRAADRAALVQLCIDGRNDPLAAAEYQQARAAHPDLAEGIGPECQLDPGPDRVAAGRLGIAQR